MRHQHQQQHLHYIRATDRSTTLDPSPRHSISSDLQHCGSPTTSGAGSVCWLIQQCPQLTHLKLDKVTILDNKEMQLLVATIQGMTRLREPDLHMCAKEGVWQAWSVRLLLALPSSSLIQDENDAARGGIVAQHHHDGAVILSEDETQLIQNLGVFYRQIASLVELEYLDLRTVYHSGTVLEQSKRDIKRNTFPGMLNLYDA
ncbi:MAG: hypothetical protein J3R72DRAFT_491365 [Linnemannia gamsii]|nr:MAG: hypothetical protein J3R72DRAFT_491365 [Linnemannia gamsii]